MTETPFSPTMLSALQAVARLKGDSMIAWTAFRTEGDDDRHAPVTPDRAPKDRTL